MNENFACKCGGNDWTVFGSLHFKCNKCNREYILDKPMDAYDFNNKYGCHSETTEEEIKRKVEDFLRQFQVIDMKFLIKAFSKVVDSNTKEEQEIKS